MLFQKMDKIKNALLSVTSNVGHYEALDKNDQYIVWAEDSEGNSLHSDNKKDIQCLSGTIDYFTKKEEDTNVVEIQRALDRHGISYELNSVQYEDETGYIHFEWIWEVS